VKNKTPIETIIVSYEDFNDPDFHYPSNYYIVNCFGEYVFYKTRSRHKAQQSVNSFYGASKYQVRSANLK
jgi:hypothetical protein